MTTVVREVRVVEQVADAVLYEGYILYPYRPTAVKNQQRWNFGVLCPGSYADAQRGTENASMQTQCLVLSNVEPVVDIKIRFLHLIVRQVCKLVPACTESVQDCGHQTSEDTPEHFELVPFLSCNGSVLQTWQEAVEREVTIEEVRLHQAQDRVTFSYPAICTKELIFDNSSGKVLGLLVRRQESISGEVEIAVFECEGGLRQLTVRIHNQSSLENASLVTRDEALLKSFVSTHSILKVHQGEFVSLLDPPECAREFAAACTNTGTFPVMAGDESLRDCMLSSPIILYDYPQIAGESAGDLFDGTEIDEILSLRIMTLTDDEKREIRDCDDRARAILERTENMPAEQFLKMHGVMRRT